MICAAALSAPFAYVPNEKSGTISIIDTATDQMTGEIKAGDKPRGIAMTPGRKMLYVSDQPIACNVIDVGKQTIISKSSSANRPRGAAFQPTVSGSWSPSRKATASRSSIPRPTSWR